MIESYTFDRDPLRLSNSGVSEDPEANLAFLLPMVEPDQPCTVRLTIQRPFLCQVTSIETAHEGRRQDLAPPFHRGSEPVGCGLVNAHKLEAIFDA